MFCTRGSFAKKVALAALMALGGTSAVYSQTATPSSGLGQQWPNAADLSADPGWHVYVFILDGIEYVQVNDLNGTVHAAISTDGNTTIVLPMGVDAQNVSTVQTASTSATVTVYSDSVITVTATPQNDGTTLFTATGSRIHICKGGYNCGGGRGG